MSIKKFDIDKYIIIFIQEKMNTITKKTNFEMVENIVKILKKHKAYLYGSYVYKTIIRNHYEKLFSNVVKPHSKLKCNWADVPEFNGDLIKYIEDVHKHREDLIKKSIQLNKEWDECTEEYYESYYNLGIFPEYKDRMIEYDSIDCYMTYDDFENLKDVFEKSDYSLTVYMYQKNTYFIAKIILKSQMTTEYEIKINISYSENIDNMANIIFKKSIFECNAIVISPYDNFMIINEIIGTSDPHRNFIKIGEIVEDIKKKTTKVIDYWDTNVTKNKVEYIINQGFNIYSEYFTTIDKKDEICIICHENCKRNKKNIKDNICNTYYCIKCYDIMINHDNFEDQCPVCKSDISSSDIEMKVIKVLTEIYDKKRSFNEI
jgi:hypothetical protein